MKAKRIIFLILICFLISSVTFIGGCVGDEDDFVFDNKYNATLYDQAIDFDWFKKDYLMDNLLNNCYYSSFDIEDNVITYLDETTGEGQRVEGYTFPKEIVTTINTQEEFDAAFKEFPDTVDFSKQFLVVFFFKTFHAIYIKGVRTYRVFRIKSTELTDKTLSIDINRKKWKGKPKPDTMTPSRRALIIKMDKVECDNISIEFS